MGAVTVPKREEKRSRVFLSAELNAGEGPTPVRIRDISRTGALLESDSRCSAGDIVQLTCGTTVLQARVAWADLGWFGVEFFTPLLVGDLMDAAGMKLQVSAPRAYHSHSTRDDS